MHRPSRRERTPRTPPPAAMVRRAGALLALGVVGATLLTGCELGASATEATPGSNVAGTVSAMGSGEVLVLKNGTYPLLDLGAKDYGSGVTIVGESRSGVVIQGINLHGATHISFTNLTVAPTASSGRSAVKIYDASSSLTFNGIDVRSQSAAAFEIAESSKTITINNTTIDGSAGRSEGSWGIWAGEWNGTGAPSDLTISNNTIKGTRNDLIHLSGANGVTISRNALSSPQSSDLHADAIQVTKGSNINISSNVMTAPGAFTHDQGMMIGNHDGLTSNVTITNNLVHHWRGIGLVIAGVKGTTVTNNTLIQSGTGAFDGPNLSAPAGENSNVTVKNNVIERIASGSGASGYSEVGNCVLSGGLSSTVKVPNLGLDPVSFRPSMGSTCVDRGDPSGAPTTDLYQVGRTGRPDAGAIESGSSALPSLAVGASLTSANASPLTPAKPATGAVSPASTVAPTTTKPASSGSPSAGSGSGSGDVSVSVYDQTTGEGSGTLSMPIRLSRAADRAVTVKYTTEPGSAEPGKDYQSKWGSVTIPAGTTQATVRIPIVEGSYPEDAEQLRFTLTWVDGVSVKDGSATVTINDND